VVVRGVLALVAILATLATAACSELLGPDPTPVPGAAATLTRSINTPIPTPVRTPSAVPAAGATRVAVAVAPSPSPTDALDAISDADVADIQRRIQQVVASQQLSGIESLLLDHVAVSTPDGGQVMDTDAAASWLRDHAGPGIAVTEVDPGTQDVVVDAQTDGWPIRDPLQQGQITFSFRRYDANGRQDPAAGGDWKIDVIEAD